MSDPRKVEQPVGGTDPDEAGGRSSLAYEPAGVPSPREARGPARHGGLTERSREMASGGQPAPRTTRARRIDRSSPLPYYHQLKQLVMADIAEKGYQPGDRLPGDHALCEAYDVSRTVVRQALSELEIEGVITRSKGRGTFVAPAPATEGLIASLTGLYEDVSARGLELRTEVTKIGVVPADDNQAASLRIDVGDPVVHIERLRFVDGDPLVFVVTDVPRWAAPGLENEDLTDESLYRMLEQGYGVHLVRGRRLVEAALAGARLARLLGLRRSDPLLVLRSVAVDRDGRPVESFVAFHRGDRSRFEVDLQRAAPTRSVKPLMVVTDGS
ncbi:MAG: GntR family transcriptional regulator [Actinomycetes bacterium]